MNNVYAEIEIIRRTISESANILENLQTYFYEISKMSYENCIEYQNQDVCLEYITYSEYTLLVANNLKTICKTLQKEINFYREKIKKLEKVLLNILTKIIKISTFTPTEMIEFLSFLNTDKKRIALNLDKISLFYLKNFNLILNPNLIGLLSLESLCLIAEYINQKYYNESLSLVDYLKQYQVTNKLNLKR